MMSFYWKLLGHSFVEDGTHMKYQMLKLNSELFWALVYSLISKKICEPPEPPLSYLMFIYVAPEVALQAGQLSTETF